MGRLLKVPEVAKALRVDDSTVRRWIKGGALEAIELPHKGKKIPYRITEETLLRLLHCLPAQV